MHGEVDGLDAGLVSVSVEGNHLQARYLDEPVAQGQAVTLALRPEKLGLDPITSANGTGLRGTVREVVYIGADTRFVVGLQSGESVVARVQNTGTKGRDAFRVGDAVKLTCAPEDVRLLLS